MTTGQDATPTPSPSSLVGQVVASRYRIHELLGEGGMGAVYLAEHTHMRKRVALKLLHAEMSKDEEIISRFRREAEAAAHVEHPNVAAATDFGQTEDGSFFLVLEYVEGSSLRKAIESGPLPPRRALHIARQIAFALERAHGAGIVHRDLKPENIMLVKKEEDDDFVKVLDFGIAKIEPHPTRDATQPLTRFGTILGTPEYMAPEQALGETVGPSADLYAVGVMLYEMLTGKHPFDAPERMAVLSMHIVAPVPRMVERNPSLDVPPPIEDVVRQLLEKDAKARPAGARAVMAAIDSAAAQCGVDLPQLASGRFMNRESNPDLSRSPAPPSSKWVADDALAKTDYGLPASVASPTITSASASARTAGLPPFLATLAEQVTVQARTLPRPLVLGVGIGVPMFVLLVIVLAVALHHPTAEAAGGDASTPSPSSDHAAAATVPTTRAPADKLRAAQAQGVPGLEALSAQYPEDAAVMKQLALSLAGVGRDADALRAVRATAKLDKDAVDDALVGLVTAEAQKPGLAEEAFALLEGPLGARGVDALLELSSNKALPPAVRTRATRSLSRPNVHANASRAAMVLLDLKSATTCTARRDWLDRAKDEGDARCLPTLKTMKNPRGCGFMGIRDCWPCLRHDDALDDAIKAVEARPTP
jgi:serine/threonine-protein kinase